MATSTAAASKPSQVSSEPPPWRSTLIEHIETMKSPVFTLATLHPTSTSTPGNASNPQYQQWAPRCRTVVYRGMWACLPKNTRNPAPLNPRVFETDLLTLTTDARMEKVPELMRSLNSRGADDDGKESAAEDIGSLSLRGGPVEAVFWMPDIMMQWRLRGHTYVIGPDIDSDAAAPVREALGAYMRPIGDDVDPQSWSWSRELTAHFGNMSPAMRGSFRNPPPGMPMTMKPEEGYGVGQKVMDLEDGLARRHFRVVVIVPDEVDQVDLSDPDRARRWNYELLSGPEDSRGMAPWKVTETWP